MFFFHNCHNHSEGTQIPEIKLKQRPRIPQIRVSNTRLAQAASGCAPSVDVLPIFDVKQQSVRNPARMGYEPPALVGLVTTTSVWGKESLPSAPTDESRQMASLKYRLDFDKQKIKGNGKIGKTRKLTNVLTMIDRINLFKAKQRNNEEADIDAGAVPFNVSIEVKDKQKRKMLREANKIEQFKNIEKLVMDALLLILPYDANGYQNKFIVLPSANVLTQSQFILRDDVTKYKTPKTARLVLHGSMLLQILKTVPEMAWDTRCLSASKKNGRTTHRRIFIKIFHSRYKSNEEFKKNLRETIYFQVNDLTGQKTSLNLRKKCELQLTKRPNLCTII
ncbi:hypothetical protein WN51_11204 [Melipona quadrifasciata]|uniref:Uncharacterized protein n=1 Tax=Melipona quadrifasciata TaxID=166423 RepID=A0A0M9A403_9HYME|nr:hypothetical protein WN51_11204 [Melipona quadrifasciata]